MKARTFALLTLVAGLSVTSYLGWALHRVCGSVWGHWPQSWPYPDKLLESWERQLNAAHPVSPGVIKLHGEWDRIRFYLFAMTALALILTVCDLIWFVILLRRRRAA